MPTITPTTRAVRVQRAFITLANAAAVLVASAAVITLAWLCGDLHITGGAP